MKILYTASDRRAAELAGLAIRKKAPRVAVVWAAGLTEARRWIDDNRNVAALIIEAESDNRSCASFIGEIRGLGVMAPVIVVSAQDPAPRLTPFDAAPDVVVAPKRSFLEQVPEIVSRALHTARRTAFDGAGDSRDESGPRDGRNGDSADPQAFGTQLTAAGDHIEGPQQELGGARRASDERRTQPQVEAGTREQLQTQLRAAVSAAEAAGRRTDAATEHLRNREAALDAIIERERAKYGDLERKLPEAQAALETIEQRHGSESATAVARLAGAQARFDERLAEAAASRVTEGQAAVEAQIALAAAARRALEQRLSDAVATLEQERRDHDAGAAAAAELHARRESDLATSLAEATVIRQQLAQQLADRDAALQRTQEQHASETATADARLAEHQKEYDARLSEAAAAQNLLRARLDASDAALQRAEEQHASDMEAAAARLAEYRQQTEAMLAQAAADAAAALQSADARSAAEQQAAAELAAHRQAVLEAELSQEVSRRQAVERALDDTCAASEQAQRQILHEVEGMRQRAREHEVRLEERAAQDRAGWEATLAGREERIRHLQAEADLDCKSLAASQAEIQRLEKAQEEERATARSTLERVSQQGASECARLEAVVAQREAQLQEQAARKLASDEATASTLAQVEHRLRLALEARDRDSRAIEQLQEQLQWLGREFDATRSERDLLKAEAGRVPLLQKQFEEIRHENRRGFEDSPASLCRCSRGGQITAVNHALARLLRYDTPEELLKADVAATVCESGDELQWVIDRCLASGSTEPIETRWTRKDGSPVIVRLIAAATTADSIDLLVEDITALRSVEEQLRNAQRMEAVARYASEVAVTCDNLLEDVKQEAQRWLATIDSETARHHGELLLDEVTRATKFLRQLAVYGNEQKNAPELVDVTKVLRDLAPVLKRVAGDGIQLVLPKNSTPLNLDVEAERVERILINVAGYGRERMPFGGRLMIEVASVTLDREFVEKYPNVRSGAHVLITITEVRGAARPDWSATIRSQVSGSDDVVTASDRPGVDLRVLQALVSDCGGHLWMLVEPPGDMVLKIHLPRRVLDGRAPAERSGGWVNRLAGVRF